MLEAAAHRPLVSSYRIEIRVGQVQMRCQCTNDLEDVGQLLRPIVWRCIIEFVCFLEEFVNKCLFVLTMIERSISRDATRGLDDRRNQITNKFSHAQ